MGHKNVFLKPGIYTYTFSYKTSRQLGFFEDFDELYWNVTGNGWNFVIENVEAVVELPQWAEVLQSAGYTGRYGSKGLDYITGFDDQGNITFTTTRSLMPKEGLTIAVAWPKGIVVEPTTMEKLGYMWKDNQSAAVAAFGFLILTSFYLLAWLKVGKDPEEGTIIDPEHELYEKKISGKILVLPAGKGSTVGSYVIFQMAKNKTAPLAIISLKAEPIIATGAIMAGIPMVDQPDADILNLLKDGDIVKVDADSGVIKLLNGQK
jgi:predicted aconitase with swiveling domain